MSYLAMTEWRSMREITRDALLGALRSLNRGGSLTYRVLVLDHRATRVLNACLRMYDITQEGIALVESLEKKRQPFPDLEVVYLVEPTREAVSRISSDFSNGATFPYANVHIFFLSRCEDDAFAIIKQNQNLTRRISTLTEVNLNYLAVEQNVFHFDLDSAFVELYSEDKTRFSLCTGKIVDNLVSVCTTLNEYPFIRYEGQNALCSKLAMDLQTKFNSFVNDNTSFWWHGDGGDGHGDQGQRAILLIVDRVEDIVAPLIHSIFYQSMVNDLLRINDGLCFYFDDRLANYRREDEDPALESQLLPPKGSKLKGHRLGEDDDHWVEFRHLQIPDVIKRLAERYDKFKNSATGKYSKDKNQLSAEDLVAVLREANDSQEVRDTLYAHMQIKELIMYKFNAYDINGCARFEQTMVSGVDENGSEVSTADLRTGLTNLLASEKVRVEDKVRLLGVYIVSQKGIKQEDRQGLFDAAKPSIPFELQSALLNLQYLGVSLNSSSSKSVYDKKLLAEAKAIVKTSNTPFTRFVPAAAKLTEQICKRSLSSERYPYVIEPPVLANTEVLQSPSLATPSTPQTSSSNSFFGGGFGSSFAAAFSKGSRQATNPESAKKELEATESFGLSVRSKPTTNKVQKDDTQPAIVTTNSKRNPKGARVIIFIAGGATHTETVAVQNLISKYNRDIIVGTTHFATPKSFLHDLEFLQGSKIAEYFAQRDSAIERRNVTVRKQIEEELGITNPPAEVADVNVEMEEIKPPQAPRKKSILDVFGCGCVSAPPPS